MLDSVLDVGARRASRARRPRLYGRFLKRPLDLLLLLLMLPFVLPIVAVLAALIKADGGPAFYSQERVGQGGRVFRMWKLRSMSVNADAELQALLQGDASARLEWDETQKLRNDPRVTRIGGIIRRSSLDELPQLWNVLVGSMSFVGPRPFMPEQQALYPGEDYYELRPGMTGFWQTSERNGTTFSDRALYDSRYHEQCSLVTDLRILAATFSVVLRGTGC